MVNTLPNLVLPAGMPGNPTPGGRPPQHPEADRRHRFSRLAMASLSPSDQRLFEQFGQGPRVPVRHRAIHRAFEEQAEARPDAVAVEHENASVTYGELDRRSDRLAGLLADHGVTNGDNVALFLTRSIPMVVGILAILKTGAAYVPQHAGAAPDRQLRHIMDVASTRIVLTTTDHLGDIPMVGGRVIICIDEATGPTSGSQRNPGEELPRFVPDRPVARDDRVFILFTSGTTGPPNGVQVTHGNVANILLTAPGNLGMEPGRRVAQILSIAFDMAAWEILGTLANGATLVVRGDDIAAAVARADTVIATPTVLATLDPARHAHVRTVAVAGEPCPLPLAEAWGRFATFYNSCGPTETTIVNTVQRFDPHRPLTIGAPTPNNTVYVLDEHQRPLPIGEVGEMWAGGDAVTAGYLNNPDLTAERYAPDPFLGDGRRMFRTRDLGRWTTGGELEHHGRTDDQVKVRGFRVELDSVSAVLESVPPTTHAVTLKLSDRHLVSFVSPATVDVESARAAVAAALPYYAVPIAVHALDEMPLTDRGKVDKRRLLETARSRHGVGIGVSA